MKNNARQIFSDKRKRIQEQVMSMRTELGKMAVEHFTASFDREGFNNVPFMHWKHLKRPRPAPYTHNKILTRTGRLRRSLRYRTRVTKDSITTSVFTTVPYAAVHNEGLRSGRGRGFKMPRRQFLGYSKLLENKYTTRLKWKLARIK